MGKFAEYELETISERFICGCAPYENGISYDSSI